MHPSHGNKSNLTQGRKTTPTLLCHARFHKAIFILKVKKPLEVELHSGLLLLGLLSIFH